MILICNRFLFKNDIFYYRDKKYKIDNSFKIYLIIHQKGSLRIRRNNCLKWKKLGQIFFMEDQNYKLRSHASNPLALHLESDIYRVFFSGRDAENRSSVSFVDIDIKKKEIIYNHQVPIFTFGPKNSFYSHGVSIGNIYSTYNVQYMLFMGWHIPNDAHWRCNIGRLCVVDNINLILDPKTPFIAIDKEDPLSLSYPWVVFHKGIYKLWYGSTITWDAGNGEMIHVIKHATSNDGKNWKKHGISIPYEIDIAQAFSRPSIIIDNKGYHMWFSYRNGKGTKYRIGYAFSDDGLNWENQLDRVGIDVSSSGWDSEMICYPFVFDHKEKRYMLYNGNRFGKDGIGLAIAV